MTIIVYKDGVLAADRLLHSGFSTQHTTKIHVLPDGRVAAAAGTISNTSYWMAALRGEVPLHPQREGFTVDGIVVSTDGKVECFSDSLIPYDINKNYFLCAGADAACFAAQVLHGQGMSAVDIVDCISKENGFSGVDTAAVEDGKWVIRNISTGE